MLLFRYADGRRALFDGNRLADHDAENPRLTMGECLVEGSHGQLAIDGFGALRHRAVGARGWTDIAYPRPETPGFGGDCVFALQRHVCNHLTSGAAIENDVRGYLRNLEIEEAIYASAESGRIVELVL